VAAGVMVGAWPFVATGGGQASSAAAAAPQTAYQMPFMCGENWRGTTRSGHSPSTLSIDWNRTADKGMPVVSSAAGTVITAQKTDKGGYGKFVLIDHGNKERTRYAHLASVTVTAGQAVEQSDLLGTVGSTGNSSGDHLHYEQIASGKVIQPYFAGVKFTFNTNKVSTNCVEVPLAADWYGYGKSRITIYRRATKSEFLIYSPGKDPAVRRYGTASDDPLVGDWDGDGTVNVGVYTPATSTFTSYVYKQGTTRITFGKAGDKPVAGDWDGDGKDEVGVWTPSTGEFRLRAANGAVTSIKLGDSNDLPVAGDWDGDGRDDVGVFDRRSATFTLRKVDSEGMVWLGQVQHGAANSMPVTGDWEADGRTDLGVWVQATAEFNLRNGGPAPTNARRSVKTIFGLNRG
ncbi:MAG TPA: M23 family metallopeptidase, partial [Nocardioides sp.]